MQMVRISRVRVSVMFALLTNERSVTAVRLYRDVSCLEVRLARVRCRGITTRRLKRILLLGRRGHSRMERLSYELWIDMRFELARLALSH